MEKINKLYLKFVPHIVWTLVLSLLYSLLVAIAIPTESLYFLFYIKGLLLIAPLVLSETVSKHAKYLWQFCLSGMILILVSYLLIQSYFYVVFSIILWSIRLVNRLTKKTSNLDTTSWVLLVPFLLYFLLSGTRNYMLYQKISVYHFAISCALIFGYYGLKRFELYLKLRKSKANLPLARIRNTGTFIFSMTVLIVSFFLITMIHFHYEFLSITAPQVNEVLVDEFTEAQTQDSEEAAFDFSDLSETDEPNPYLVAFWNLLEHVFQFIMYFAFFIGVIYAVHRLIINFRDSHSNTTDFIESTIDSTDNTITLPAFVSIRNFFDFSYSMKVRRQYRSTLKKHKPHNWQTPSEMEEMAQLDIPELHQEYEKIRYGSPD
ncbi:MAG: hypothetical protein R3Y58_06220 [Eubacteriales bacterium]